MRCGGALICKGDTMEKVLNACGKPYSGDLNEKYMTEWLYNRGPTEDVYIIKFYKRQVTRIETTGHGW
jgi:hypothetical protein